MSVIRIVFINIDTQRLTLYKEDGSTVYVPQGDPQVQRIIDEAMPLLNQGKVAEIDLSIPGSFGDFEEQTNGFVRFFKVAKKKLSKLFSDPIEPIMPGEFGNRPNSQTKAQQVAEVMKHATPMRGNLAAEESEENTIIAVVNDKIIPGVEKIRDHVKHAAKLGSTKGMEAFFKRVAAVADKRQHSVQDMLLFLERADLPIADDGSIIAYKVLTTNSEGKFVDCYTKKVTQRIGSEVRVDESLVDRDRKNECSNGLHIARRAYLAKFGGTACFLTKIAPEDVVAVPHKDPNKVRVCAYHIIEQLTPEAFAAVRSNKPMTENAAIRTMLARAISGDHIGKIEQVLITKQMGMGLEITSLVPTTESEPITPVEEIKNAIALDDPEMVEAEEKASTVSPKEINKKIEASRNQEKEQHMKSVAPTKLSRKLQAAMYAKLLMAIDTPADVRFAAARDLYNLKKRTKVSWDVLAVQDKEVQMMEQMLAEQPPLVPVKTSKKTKELSQKLRHG